MLGSGTGDPPVPPNRRSLFPTTPDHDEVRFLTGASRPKLYRFGYIDRATGLSRSIGNTASAPPKVLRFIGFAHQPFGI